MTLRFEDWPEGALQLAREAVTHGVPSGWTAVLWRPAPESVRGVGLDYVDMPWSADRADIKALKATRAFDWWSGPVRVEELRILGRVPEGPKREMLAAIRELREAEATEAAASAKRRELLAKLREIPSIPA